MMREPCSCSPVGGPSPSRAGVPPRAGVGGWPLARPADRLRADDVSASGRVGRRASSRKSPRRRWTRPGARHKEEGLPVQTHRTPADYAAHLERALLGPTAPEPFDAYAPAYIEFLETYDYAAFRLDGRIGPR